MLQPEIKEKWITALTDGSYKQGQLRLRVNNKFCCLGVLCDLYRKETGRGTWVNAPEEDHGTNAIFSFDGHIACEPGLVREWSGLTMDEGITLASKNDSGQSFTTIAEYIKESL